MTSSPLQVYESVMIGVDEAGRGPLIGDMVVAGVALPSVLEGELAVAGVRDSKKLTPEAREGVYNYLLNISVMIVVAYVPPWVLDSENLNDIEVKYISKVIEVLSKLLYKVKPGDVHIIVDEVKGREEAIKKAVHEKFSYVVKSKVVVEASADSKYVPTGAASIVAKVSRDVALKPLKKLVGDFGSGYSSDPRTRNWALTVYTTLPEAPLFVRRSWSTLRDIAPRWYIDKSSRDRKVKSLLDYAKR